MFLEGILITVVFLLYIQFSPTMGNIWYRCGYFTPMGALNVMVYPFKNILMWKPNMWIINYPIWLIVSLVLFET